MASKEDQALFRAVEQWLRDNPGKNIGDWKKETGYTGPDLKKRGPTRVSFKGKSAEANIVREARIATQTAGEDVYGKGVVAAKGSKLQEHHKRVVAIYAPFFEGLNEKETNELARWFVNEGAPLGNVKENLEALSKQEHKAIHNWMKDNLMQVDPKDFPSFKNYSLNERFPAALTFLEQIQPAAEEQIDKLKLLRKSAKGLAIAGAAAPFAVGLPMSAAETAQRYRIAQETKDPLDALQTVISGFSGAGDIVSLFPPTAPLGEAVSTSADVLNPLITEARENPEQAKAIIKQAVKGVAESLVPDPIGDLQQGITNARSMLKKLQRAGSRFLPISQ
jgi:hypothetical protein